MTGISSQRTHIAKHGNNRPLAALRFAIDLGPQRPSREELPKMSVQMLEQIGTELRGLAPLEVRAAVFDVDQTLGDLYKVVTTTAESALDKLSQARGIPADVIAQEWRMFPPELICHEPARLIAHTPCLQPFDDKMQRIALEWQQERWAIEKPFRGAIESLKDLHDQGVKVYISSNGVPGSLFRRMAAWDIPTDIVAGVYIRNEMSAFHAKPLPDALLDQDRAMSGYRETLEPRTIYVGEDQKKPSDFALIDISRKTGIPTGEIAMVGDSPKSDGVSARTAGAKFVMVTYGTQYNADMIRRYERVAGERPEICPVSVGHALTAETRPDRLVYSSAGALTHVMQAPGGFGTPALKPGSRGKRTLRFD